MYPQASNTNYLAQQRLTVATMGLVRHEWASMGSEFDASWAKVGPRVTVLTASAQLGAARLGAAYVASVLDELDFDAPIEGGVVAESLAGVASDGRPLGSLLDGAVVRAKESIGGGAGLQAALSSAGSWLDQVVHTQVADAGRNGAGVSMHARPKVTGYVRQLNLPSCARCAVFAGRWFPVDNGFRRHPGCDCQMIPSQENRAGDFTTDPLEAIKAGQVTGLSKADTRAIVEDGADVSKVINTHRQNMPYSTGGLKFTREAAGRRPRLMPESIYQQASSREDAIRLLKLHRYIT